MIKVSVFYPADGGVHFDHDYYRTKHLPLIKKRLGDACIRYSIDKGIEGGSPGTPPMYIASCHIFSASVEVFQSAFQPHADEIRADVPSYTDIVPIMQISSVVE